MTKLLLGLSTAILSLGMLGAAACTGCSPSNTNNTNSSALSGPQSMSCGPGTTLQGTQCVANTTSAANAASAPLKTTGNN